MNYNDKSKQFVRACLTEDYDTVSRMMSDWIPSEAKEDGFLFACEFGFNDIAVRIYESGSLLYGNLGFVIACRNNNVDLLRDLMDTNARNDFGIMSAFMTIFRSNPYEYQPFLVLILSEYHQYFSESSISSFVFYSIDYDLFDLFFVAIELCDQTYLDNILLDVDKLPPNYLRVIRARYHERFGVNPIVGIRSGPYVPAPVENMIPVSLPSRIRAPLYVAYIERRRPVEYREISRVSSRSTPVPHRPIIDPDEDEDEDQ